MLAQVTSFLVPLVIGVFITMAVEAVTGRTWGVILRRRFLSRSRRRLARLGDPGDLIARGPELMYVIEFVPGGWARGNITFREHASRDLAAALASADRENLPADPDELVARIDAMRDHLDDDGVAHWNGDMVGVEQIQTSRTGVSERPRITLTTVPSDFAAATVCTDLWLEQFDAGNVTLPSDLDRPIPGMLHAIGVNATLVTDDEVLVLVRRSARAASGRTGLHISVNEGMQDRDRDSRRNLDPFLCLSRGVHEELGVEIDPAWVRLHTAMFDLRRYQLGLLGHIDLAGTGITAADLVAARRHGLSQDKFENSELVLVPWTLPAVVEKLREDDWLAHGWLNLVHSAIDAFPTQPDELHALLGERPRRTPTGVGGPAGGSAR